PGDLPGVVVGIGDVASKAAVGRRIPHAQDPTAEARQPVDDGLNLFPRGDIVRQSEGAGAREAGSAHVAFQCACEPGSEDKAVHLIEDDLRVLEDRLPAETLDIEAAGAGKVGYP